MNREKKAERDGFRMANMIETPVLIAGGGPVGMTLALNLARYGVRSLLVERNPATTRHPKMDLTNARSMELFKRLGLAEKLRAAGVPRENAFDISWVTSLVGHELYGFHYPSATAKRKIILLKTSGHAPREHQPSAGKCANTPPRQLST